MVTFKVLEVDAVVKNTVKISGVKKRGLLYKLLGQKKYYFKCEQEVVVGLGGYTGHIKCAEAFFQLGLRR